jgi:GTPase Era involved in 16S rRNA processing
MGEFSTGKSSFVNALLGAEVAPTGITPTTATINVLKYGAEKRGRIIYRDDRERVISWDDIPGVLRGLDATEAATIRHVELLYPLEALERVSIVDTPGLNSILPEHEQTARDFIRHADAVVWLFSAMQAGKATEREALERIRAEGKRVLGVVNKVDQASPEELAQILAHLGKQLGDTVEAFVPVSARRALDSRVRGDAAALEAAHWPALERALEERFFAQARKIKREQALRRLAALTTDARTALDTVLATADTRAQTLTQAAAAARADAQIFRRASVPEQGKRLAEGLAHAYRAAAREVLDLVRPRRMPFGSNTATEADRDYLVGVLDRALAAMLVPAQAAVAAELRAAHAAAAEPADDAIALVEARVFDRCRAYLRGYLRGGSVDDFFARTLPRLSLDEDAVYHALVRGAPDLAVELLAPLADAGESALRALATRIDRTAAAADLERFELADILVAALDRLDAQRATLQDVAHPA